MSTKRGNGEGTIRERASGLYEARYTDADGTRHSLYGKTRQEVARALVAAQRDRDLGLPSVAEQQTVAHYLTSWLARVKLGVEESTWIRYEIHVRNHLLPAFGTLRLTRLTPQQVQQLYTEKIAAGLSSTTVNHLHGVLHHALADALRLQLVPRNVCDAVDPPRVAKRHMAIFTPEQVDALLRAARAHRLEALLVVEVTTGLRINELLALTWADIDLTVGFLQVRRNRSRRVHGYADADTKTEHGRRRIRLSRVAIDALRDHRYRQMQERLSVGAAWKDEDRVFASGVGTALDDSNVRKQFYLLLAHAGLPRIHFHDLRHSAASWLIAQGVPVTVVSELLGHADPSITMRIYAHVLPDAQERAVEVMDRLIRRHDADDTHDDQDDHSNQDDAEGKDDEEPSTGITDAARSALGYGLGYRGLSAATSAPTGGGKSASIPG